MSQQAIELMLAERIGLNVEAIGRRALESAIQHRMAERELTKMEDYFSLLSSEAAERDELVESVVVPETWFFRDTEPFRQLARKVTQAMARNVRNQSRPWRVLSVPCATGEEAYSAAIALADVGLPIKSIHVTGVDISRRALAVARGGNFGDRSFRGLSGIWWQSYFTANSPSQRQVVPRIREAVRFVQGNALDPTLLSAEPEFDFVFCRNLLIYLTASARRVMTQQFSRWLKVGGLLFLGHAEAGEPPGPSFRAVEPPGAFAFERVDSASKTIRQAAGKPRRIVAKSAGVLIPNVAENTDSDWARAQELADRGELAPAADVCEHLLATHHPTARGYCLLGIIYLAASRYRSAEECFKRAIQLEPYHHESLVHLMLLCEREGRGEQAAELRRQVDLAVRKESPR